MEIAIHPAARSSEGTAPTNASAPTLNVSAIYTLSEAGRKASLLAGGNGHATQRLTVQVPATRLHLVSVDAQGVARLKLQPRFELTDDQGVVRRDGPRTYDVPPSIEDLFKEAARNHELERVFRSERARSRDHRREEDQARRRQAAEEFLTDAAQRAMVHPIPTPKRCFLATANGRLMFDVATDVGPARDLPSEAYRRFRSDLRARKEHNLKRRAEQLALHEEKTRAITEWVAAHGSPDQQARLAAGLLPAGEIVEAMTEDAFAALPDQPRYRLDGAARLQDYLRTLTGRADIVVAPADLEVVGADASTASATQWAAVRTLQEAWPDAKVVLRQHRLSWQREPALPALIVNGALVTRQVGPFILRREFAVPEQETDTGRRR